MPLSMPCYRGLQQSISLSIYSTSLTVQCACTFLALCSCLRHHQLGHSHSPKMHCIHLLVSTFVCFWVFNTQGFCTLVLSYYNYCWCVCCRYKRKYRTHFVNGTYHYSFLSGAAPMFDKTIVQSTVSLNVFIDFTCRLCPGSTFGWVRAGPPSYPAGKVLHTYM